MLKKIHSSVGLQCTFLPCISARQSAMSDCPVSFKATINSLCFLLQEMQSKSFAFLFPRERLAFTPSTSSWDNIPLSVITSKSPLSGSIRCLRNSRNTSKLPSELVPVFFFHQFRIFFISVLHKSAIKSALNWCTSVCIGLFYVRKLWLNFSIMYTDLTNEMPPH